MTITFADDFLNQPNQAYIALSGSQESMIQELEQLIREVRCHGKPMQGIISSFGGKRHVITPVWNNRKYY